MQSIALAICIGECGDAAGWFQQGAVGLGGHYSAARERHGDFPVRRSAGGSTWRRPWRLPWPAHRRRYAAQQYRAGGAWGQGFGHIGAAADYHRRRQRALQGVCRPMPARIGPGGCRYRACGRRGWRRSSPATPSSTAACSASCRCNAPWQHRQPRVRCSHCRVVPGGGVFDEPWHIRRVPSAACGRGGGGIARPG